MSAQGRPKTIELDPRRLKALAHPLRVQLLGLLRENGPATASMLAGQTGESSGATSYHLRQLAEFGFIEEDKSKSGKRDRWWKASHVSTHFDESAMLNNSETSLLAGEYLRAIIQAHSQRALSWLEQLPRQEGEWEQAGTVSDWGLSLSPWQLSLLQAELEEVISRYPAHNPEIEMPEGNCFVSAQLQLLPRFPERRKAETP
ncbi:MAG: helix-turn-helix domain-containing protein [Spirochaetes bacterium]|nr:helix-turn-helix domain-containing protein [Spirochaetota bacterium]